MTMPMKTRMSGSMADDHARQPRFDFLVVELADICEHFRQRAGRFADLDHLDGQVAHGPGVLERAPQRLAFAHVLHDAEDLRARRSWLVTDCEAISMAGTIGVPPASSVPSDCVNCMMAKRCRMPPASGNCELEAVPRHAAAAVCSSAARAMTIGHGAR